MVYLPLLGKAIILFLLPHYPPPPTPCQHISATKTKTEELVQIEEGKRNVTSDGDTKSRVFFLLRNKILIKSFLLGRLTKSEKALQIE